MSIYIYYNMLLDGLSAWCKHMDGDRIQVLFGGVNIWSGIMNADYKAGLHAEKDTMFDIMSVCMFEVIGGSRTQVFTGV